VTNEERRLVPIRQGRMATWVWGEGEPVFLLHPLALAGELWRPLGTALAADFQVFAPDQRGHGRTSWDREPFSIEDMAGDLGDALDSLGLDSVHLLGMSMGGSVAMTFAGKYPDRVRSLTLADTTAWYGENAVTAWRERAEKAVGVPREKQVTFQVDRWFSEPFRAGHPSEVQRVVDIFVDTDSEAHAAASLAMGAMDSRHLLPSVTARTLVLVGEQDYATPPAMAEVLAQEIPATRLLVLPGLRHLSLVEKPELAALVRAHLNGTEVPA
jgi:3-oxoadipate enol-lactonase